MNFLLTDSNILRLYPLLADRLRTEAGDAYLIVVEPGEAHKSLESAQMIWQTLCEKGATRSSHLICLGGGMVSDLGGFAAACFKRGIPHRNVATTLLAAVDAAIGGKAAINFHGLKNEIGAFKMPERVEAAVETFATLPDIEILSGWGEAVKTALIADEEMTRRMLAEEPLEIPAARLSEYVDFCRRTKEQIVAADPTENGLRRVLNLGHTAGHAFESLLLELGRPTAHGVAVSHGLLTSLILSHLHAGLDKTWVSFYRTWLRDNYPSLRLNCGNIPRLMELARHDKKNDGSAGLLSCVLLQAPGVPIERVEIPEPLFAEALELTLC